MIVDVSKYQSDIDWEQLAPSLDFAIVKATGDKNYGVDPTFEYNATQCKAKNVPLHVYHYLRALTVADTQKEAAFFFATASPYQPVSYVLDIEGDSLTCGKAIDLTKAFISELRRLGAKCVGLYTGYYAYREHGFTPDLADWLWIARYGKNDGKIPSDEYKPKPIPCDLWQYTSKGTAPGIASMVDLSTLYGDKPLSYFKGGGNMATVMIGSARGDENGGAYNGKAGDQTGKEVSTQAWYKHSKGWRVFRAKSSEAAEKIAYAMQAACDNPNVGYDQYQRNTLYNAAEPFGFDPAKVTTPCETDCSALVRVCCAYAGIMLPDFNTATEPDVLKKSGAFDELYGDMYTDKSDYLERGDILDTRTKGHTVVVLSDGSRAGEDEGTLRRGDKGELVKALQRALLAKGFSVGKSGVDGDFGPATESAVKKFQQSNNLYVDGVVGPATWKALTKPEPKYTMLIRGLTRSEVDEEKSKWNGHEIEVVEE